jgi:hypothetical protein
MAARVEHDPWLQSSAWDASLATQSWNRQSRKRWCWAARMYQLPFAKDVFSNCPTQISFNVSGEDANAIAENWRYTAYPEELKAEDITRLPRYEFYCRTFVDDEPKVVKLRGYPTLTQRGDESTPTKLIKHSIERWGKDRKQAQEKIYRFLK